MRELELEMRLRNNRLKQRRRELGLSAPQVADQIGISYGSYIELESLRASPIGKTGEWRPVAVEIANFHGASCEELWPDSVLAVTAPVVRREIDARDVLMFLGPEECDPELLLAEKEEKQAIRTELREVLSEREIEVLTRRFDDEMSLAQAGKRLLTPPLRNGKKPRKKRDDVTPESVRSIEAKAIRKLRDSRSFRALVGER